MFFDQPTKPIHSVQFIPVPYLPLHVYFAAKTFAIKPVRFTNHAGVQHHVQDHSMQRIADSISGKPRRLAAAPEPGTESPEALSQQP